MRRALAILALLLLPFTAAAVQPDEVLDDPALEERARTISADLRCPVCQNESIDESSAEIARNLRLLVRERLLAGDSDAEVVAYIVARYGEFVLLDPPVRGSTWILWLAGPVLAIGGALIAVSFVRRRAREAEPVADLSADEQAELDRILKD